MPELFGFRVEERPFPIRFVVIVKLECVPLTRTSVGPMKRVPARCACHVRALFRATDTGKTLEKFLREKCHGMAPHYVPVPLWKFDCSGKKSINKADLFSKRINIRKFFFG